MLYAKIFQELGVANSNLSTTPEVTNVLSDEPFYSALCGRDLPSKMAQILGTLQLPDLHETDQLTTLPTSTRYFIESGWVSWPWRNERS